MKVRMNIIVFALALLLTIASCGILPHPDTFKLDKTVLPPINCFILSDINSVEKTFDNEILLHKKGICSLKRDNITTSKFQLTATLRGGDGLRVSMRSDMKKYKTEPGIILEWAKTGTKILENGKQLMSESSIRAFENKPVNFTFVNQGNFYYIVLECDTIYRGITDIPCSEYYILESVDADLKISGIKLEDLYGFEYKEILNVDEEGKRTREETLIIKQ